MCVRNYGGKSPSLSGGLYDYFRSSLVSHIGTTHIFFESSREQENTTLLAVRSRT
ncbi:uncharacterized protein LOC143146777 isoform X3 [Ptiloglossa arizonensis]|uniref:uncharacterized protein LOC143146777 isoform X3 n=1 Tax=Ptiloglossa arizonensis TaxID=3350558 RepID=UPI003FA0F6D5